MSRRSYVTVIDGRAIEVRNRRENGSEYVQALVYPTDRIEGEPVADWELPISLRYDHPLAAEIAARQTPKQETSSVIH